MSSLLTLLLFVSLAGPPLQSPSNNRGDGGFKESLPGIGAARDSCVVECPPGALQEGEPICQDGYVDSYNCGCCGGPPPG